MNTPTRDTKPLVAPTPAPLTTRRETLRVHSSLKAGRIDKTACASRI